MSDEQPKADSPDAPGTPPAASPEPEEKRFTQEQLDAIVKERLAKEQKKHAKALEAAKAQAKPEAKPDTQPPQGEPPDMSAVLSELGEVKARLDRTEKDKAFAEVLATVPNADKLTKRQRDVLRRDFDPEKPEATVQDAKELFGVAADSQQKEGDKPATTQPEGVASKYVDGGAPSAGPREPELNPLKWSQDDIARMRRDGTFLKHLETWRQSVEGGGGLFAKRIPEK